MNDTHAALTEFRLFNRESRETRDGKSSNHRLESGINRSPTALKRKQFIVERSLSAATDCRAMGRGRRKFSRFSARIFVENKSEKAIHLEAFRLEIVKSFIS